MKLKLRLNEAVSSLEKCLLRHPKSSNLSKFSGWDDYITKRGLEEWASTDTKLRKQLLSKLCSFPLTVLSTFKELDISHNSPRVIVYGARSELTLPGLYWSEIINFLPQTEQLNLVFVINQQGFAVRKSQPNLGSSTRTNISTFSGSFPLGLEESQAELHCFFNSGIGHELEHQNWNPTGNFFEQLGDLASPCVFTSYNSSDFNRDVSHPVFKGQVVGIQTPNPFGSLWVEGVVDNEEVFNNHSKFLISPVQGQQRE